MAEAYIATLEAEFDPTRYHSEYREALEALVEAKASGLEPPQPQEEAADSGEVVDLVAALRASVEAAKRRRGEQTGTEAEAATAASGDGATKKAATKKTAAKKSAAKKSTAKKSASKSTAKKGASSRSTAKKTTAKKSTAKRSTAQKRKSA